MPFPRADEKTRAFFQSIMSDYPGVELKPMFGHIAAFINGNMFAGTFGSDIALRLSTEARAELLREEGASVFEPMPGRPMKEYVMLPSPWLNDPEKVRRWVSRALEWAAQLPPKGRSGRRR